MRWHWWYLPGYVWALPVALIGLLLALVYRPQAARWSGGCLEFIAGTRANGKTRIWGQYTAQTLGFVIWYASGDDWDWRPTRVHERVHVVQYFACSVFFLIAYFAHFLYLFATANTGTLLNIDYDDSRWDRAYRKIWFERQAYRIEAEYTHGDRPWAWGVQ